MKTFFDFFNESARNYKFRLKFPVELSEEQNAALDFCLSKYHPKSVDGPRRLMFQDNPLDFQGVENTWVWIYDIVTDLPVSSYVLQQEIRAGLKMPEKYVVVRGADEPKEIESQAIADLNDIKAQAVEKDLTPMALLGDGLLRGSDYLPSEQTPIGNNFYGNGYNSAFLQHLAQMSATREPDGTTIKNPVFAWLDEPKQVDGNEFNDNIMDAPRSIPFWKALVEPVTPDFLDMIARNGQLTTVDTEKSKDYVDNKGKVVTVTPSKSSKAK